MAIHTQRKEREKKRKKRTNKNKWKKEKEESPWNVTVPAGPPRPRSKVIGESGEGGERSGPRLGSCV